MVFDQCDRVSVTFLQGAPIAFVGRPSRGSQVVFRKHVTKMVC